VQVAPIKPKLKAPRTTRLKVKHDGPLSKIAFKFNLRLYPSVSLARRLLTAGARADAHSDRGRDIAKIAIHVI
jgi:hypothetical protein